MTSQVVVQAVSQGFVRAGSEYERQLGRELARLADPVGAALRADFRVAPVATTHPSSVRP